MQPTKTLLETARRHREAGRLVQARHNYDEALRADPDDAHALHGLGVVSYQDRDFSAAATLLALAAARADREPSHHCDLGRALLTIGRRAEGIACLWRSVELDPDYLEAHLLLSEALLPGEHYHQVLERLHAWLQPRVYIEIGTEVGHSMALVRSPTIALGIDPAPRIERTFVVEPQIFAMTSDAFFASTDLRAVTGMPSFDLAFIDGMHTFDQALRDFINLEARAHAQSVVLVHDCLPLSAATATRAQQTRFWSGDTWRLIPLLKRHRPDLTIRTIPCRPTGLAVITGLDPRSTRLDADYDALVAAFIDLPLADRRDDDLDLIANEWPPLAQHLAQALGRTQAA